MSDNSLLISCSWHQTTKQPILFSPIISTYFSQFEQLKKKTNFLLVQNWGKICFGQPIKSVFSFPSWEKFMNKIRKNKIRGLVVRCHEQDIRCAITFTSFVWWSKEFFKNQIKGLSNSLDINMSGSDNYTTSIGIQNLSKPFENPISASLFILFMVLGILGILCLLFLTFKLVEKVFPHSTRYVFRMVIYNKHNFKYLKTSFYVYMI